MVSNGLTLQGVICGMWMSQVLVCRIFLMHVLQDRNDQMAHSMLFSSLTDMSLKDWDVKEQEGLREVEKILDRADEILEVRDATFE